MRVTLMLLVFSGLMSGCATIGDLRACHPLRDPRSDSFIACAALRQVARQYPSVWARAMEIRAERERVTQVELVAETRLQAFGQGVRRGFTEAIAEYAYNQKIENSRNYRAFMQARQEMGENAR